MPAATAGQQQQQQRGGKECRLSGGLARASADPVRGSGDGGSPVSRVVEEKGKGEEKVGAGFAGTMGG